MPRSTTVGSGAATVAPPSPSRSEPLASLDRETRRLYAEWTAAKQKSVAYAASVVAARECLVAPPPDAARLDEWRGERQRAEAVLGECDLVLPALDAAATAAGLAWSAKWSEWHTLLRHELLGDIEAERDRVLAKLGEREAAARAELEVRTAEMPA